MIQSTGRTENQYIQPLREVRLKDVHLTGSKAATLGELASVGFPVPDGFVISTRAFDRFMEVNSPEGMQNAEDVFKAALPQEVEAELRMAIENLDGISFAVRSSSVAEDLREASFAGQYQTILNVQGYKDVAEAVLMCWKSAFSDRISAYKKQKSLANNTGMAVLVQRLVRADTAGVAFTVNPVNGRRDETVVNAVKGLGERLVSGESSPDEWIVRGEDASPRSTPENAIDVAQAREIARLARNAEMYFGTPQDIEWAIGDGKLFILQSRPITTLDESVPVSVPIPINPPPGFWEREFTHFPRPISPLFRSTMLPAHIEGMRLVFKESSMLADGVDFREIGGWIYTRLVPPGGKDMPAPPAWSMPVLIRLVPEMRKRIKGMVQAVRKDLIGQYIERWYSEWKPAQISKIEDMQTVDLEHLSDVDLKLHLEKAHGFIRESYLIHAKVTGIDFVVAELAFTCRDLFGWDDRQALDLLAGLSSTTSEPSLGLNQLSIMVRKQPALVDLLDHLDANTVNQLPKVDPEFSRTFDAYQRQYSIRPLYFDVEDPTLAEQPELVLLLIRHQIGRDYNPQAVLEILERRRLEMRAEANKALSNRPAADREKFERALSRAERGYPIREEHEFYLTGAPAGLLRYAALETGERLRQRGQIGNREDIFFLEVDEVLAALLDGSNQQSVVNRRKGERAWAFEHPGPASYGKNPGAPPSFAAFPHEARYFMEALMWEMETNFANDQSRVNQDGGSSTLRGIAASAGRYTGKVRVIRHESEFDRIQPGDVLVCPATSPVWSVIFPSVGALVTDMGGILSHPAIIAREFHLPAVVATGNATNLLTDGQIVTVDGNIGLVEKVL